MMYENKSYVGHMMCDQYVHKCIYIYIGICSIYMYMHACV